MCGNCQLRIPRQEGMMAIQRWGWYSLLLLLGTATTVVSADTGVSNACLTGHLRPAARNTKNVVSLDMLLNIFLGEPQEQGKEVQEVGIQEEKEEQ